MSKGLSEKLSTILVAGLFVLALIIVHFTAGNLPHMGWLTLALVAVDVFLVAAIVKVVKNFDDPNYYKWRIVVIVTAVAGIILIMAHRADWLHKLQFLQ